MIIAAQAWLTRSVADPPGGDIGKAHPGMLLLDR